MRSVGFEFNQIKHVGSNLLEPFQSNLGDIRFASNICVNQNANTAVTISALISHIRIFCADIETLEDVTIEEVKYHLKVENQELKERIKDLENN